MTKNYSFRSSPDKGKPGGVFIFDSLPFIPYEPGLKEYARRNRKNPTVAEQKMWSILQRKQFSAFKFTRQKPLDKFIADFYCPKLLLVIEIDGDSHVYQEEYDQVRTDTLQKRYGIIVVRYTNSEIMRNIEGVYDDLAACIEKRFQELNPPQPSLIREGA